MERKMSKLTNMVAVAVGGFILAAALAPTAANAYSLQAPGQGYAPLAHAPVKAPPLHPNFSAHRGGHFSKK
jgi:hypothetical protein